MGMIKDKNNKDLKEAEEIKKRWQEYTELYEKELNDLYHHNGVVSHLEPEILGCEVKQALGTSLWIVSGGDEFQLNDLNS